MNIANIKNRADELLVTCKPQVIRIMTIMMLVGLIPSLFSESKDNLFVSLISLVITILFITFNHGYVVTTLKVVRNDAQSLSDDDAFVGFRRFKELISTYLLTAIVILLVGMAAIFVVMFLFMMLFGGVISTSLSNTMNYYHIIGNGDYSYLFSLLQMAPSLALLILLLVLAIIIIIGIISIFVFAVPYLLEQYHMTNTLAIKESFQLMKNHVWDMIKLELSFIGWMILVAIIQSILTRFLIFIPILGSLIASIVAGFIGIYTYLPKFYVSQAIFFEEIAYYRYDQPYQNSMNDQGNVNHV